MHCRSDPVERRLSQCLPGACDETEFTLAAVIGLGLNHCAFLTKNLTFCIGRSNGDLALKIQIAAEAVVVFLERNQTIARYAHPVIFEVGQQLV